MSLHPIASRNPARLRRGAALVTLTAAVALAGCSTKREAPAPIVPPVVVPVDRGPAPTPPNGAAANLAIPVRMADGQYATLNQQISLEMAAWHLRAAFNVAALNCPDPTLNDNYNKILSQHRTELTKVHKAASTQGGKQFDSAMTRVYNYFAQPPVLNDFCQAVVPLAAQAAIWPKGTFTTGATPALNQLDYPFQQFYGRYDAYRVALQNWQNSAPAQMATVAPATADASIATPR